mgnify:CR=1 FL=1
MCVSMSIAIGSISAALVITVRLSYDQIREKYTDEEWRGLHEYWAHPLFKRVRPCGFLLGIIAIIAVIPPVVSTNWVKYEIYEQVNFTYSKSLSAILSVSSLWT